MVDLVDYPFGNCPAVLLPRDKNDLDSVFDAAKGNAAG